MRPPTDFADRHGTGSFRRRIRLVTESPGLVLGAVEDEMHHYRVRLAHDGEVVTGVEGEPVRVPWTTCPDAGARLTELVGVTLTRRPQHVVASLDPRLHCTHWLDLAVLAVIHAATDRHRRQFDIEVPDWFQPPFGASLLVDGAPLLRWEVGRDLMLESPEPFAGRRLIGGFSRWAESTLDDEMVEAAFVLHRGTWLSAARRIDLEAADDATEGQLVPAVCHSGQPDVMPVALRSRGSLRDYGRSPDPLLTAPGDPV
ncbi:MAG: DUF2889 domain-containing protein [Acidimicrobiia bacterium]|nr:DUF2889 domain-containing protein [Acidimicrobiia bacterium]